jgi:hypothetical protein
MSAITSDWAPVKTEAPLAARNTMRNREEEFRSALERYIADYQRHHAVTIDSTGRGAGNTFFSFFRRLAGASRS